jgi:transposase
MLFLDAKHQLYNVKNGYCWQLKGKFGTRLIYSNTGRRRLNIMGALNSVSLDVTSVLTESNCNKEFVILFLLEVKKAYSNSNKIYLILDNALYNRSYDVQEIAEELGIELIYLPSYCPNLSLIERFWKFFIKKTITNIYYDTYEKFFDSIFHFLGSIKDYVEDLKKLITMNFEIIKQT